MIGCRRYPTQTALTLGSGTGVRHALMHAMSSRRNLAPRHEDGRVRSLARSLVLGWRNATSEIQHPASNVLQAQSYPQQVGGIQYLIRARVVVGAVRRGWDCQKGLLI